MPWARRRRRPASISPPSRGATPHAPRPDNPSQEFIARAATTTRAAAPARSTKTAAAAAARRLAEIRRVADLLKQVSDPTRLQVLLLLEEQERNVTELCSDLGTQSQPAVSHHLALLRHGRLIEPRRSGKHNYYVLTEAGRELAAVVRSIVR
jgi:DNA-binding transcriptional ArsR family regulator